MRACPKCRKEYPSHASACPHCGFGERAESPGGLSPAAKLLVGAVAFGVLSWFFVGRDRTAAPTVTDSDIVWHAENTYGFPCGGIVSRLDGGDVLWVECESGENLRVVPRSGKHPKIERE